MGQGNGNSQSSQTFHHTSFQYSIAISFLYHPREILLYLMACNCCGRHCSRRELVKLMLRRQLKLSLRTMIVPKITSQLLAYQNIPWITFILRPQSSGSEVRMSPRRQESRDLFGGFSTVALTGMSLTSY